MASNSLNKSTTACGFLRRLDRHRKWRFSKAKPLPCRVGITKRMPSRTRPLVAKILREEITLTEFFGTVLRNSLEFVTGPCKGNSGGLNSVRFLVMRQDRNSGRGFEFAEYSFRVRSR
jgi:hypothetical protein